ncbi:hypothetical protein PG988_007704 [Apiospora saccharicola]
MPAHDLLCPNTGRAGCHPESLGREVWYPREILEDRFGERRRRPSGKEANNWFCLCTAFGGAGANDEYGAGLLVPNAAGPDPVATREEYMRWCHLEAAVLDKMAMTREGTAVLFADERAMNDGLMLLCQLEMEAEEGNGMVYDYDHGRFRTTEELEALPLGDDDLMWPA